MSVGQLVDHAGRDLPAEVDGPAAQAIGLSKVYGTGDASVHALDNVTVAFERSRLTAIMGPSGSGKSTLMHCMAALDAPTSGRVVIDGVDISHLKDRQLTKLRRDRLGFVFQAYNLIPTLTARENITLPLDIAGSDVDHAWFDTVIDTLGIRDRLSHRPDELSGGQQQRVACARALVSRPAIVFADEPTGNLDSKASAEILAFLRASVDDFAQTIVMVTHDPSAASYADRVVFLADGHIVDDLLAPTLSQVLERIEHLDRVPARGLRMLRVTLRGLQGHLLRLLMTAVAVMLGVSFVTGTFVLRDSFDRALGGLVAGASAGLDVAVRGTEVPGGDGARTPLPLTLEDTLAAVPGVQRVAPDLVGTAIIAGKDGIAVRNSGAPGLGFAFSADDPTFTVVAGRGPAAAGEVAVESATLAKAGLEVGDTTKAVIGGETSTVTITGEVKFGTLFGATAVLVDEATARRLFAPDGTVSDFTLTAEPQVSQRALRAAVAQVLPPGVEAVTGDTVHAEDESAVQEGLGFFTIFLLVFAGVALFVGAFIIVNTFSMLIGQRARELALLRALGASGRQVLVSVLVEAAAVGVVGSLLGMGLGVLVAQGAKLALRGLLGVDIGTSLPVTATTLAISLVVGTVVTVLAAILPARRAARTAPVAAMRGDLPIAPRGLRRRGTLGLALLAVGGGVLLVAVKRTDVLWIPAAVGALLTVIGLLVGAPWVARPVVRVIVWPFVLVAGVVARLARQNALRVPRRTAATASALMIGLALVAGISVLAESVKASVTQGVTNELTSDFVLNGGVSPVPASVAPAAAALPGVRSVAALSMVPVRVGAFSTTAAAASAAAVADNFTVTMDRGPLDALRGDAVLVDRTTATTYGWQVGDVLTGTVGNLQDHRLVVGGIYDDSQAFGSHLIVDRALYRAAVPESQQVDRQVFVRADSGTDLAALRDELVTIVKPYLVVSVQSSSEFATSEGAAIDNLLNLLYVLLLFSVVIAILGIVNTLALSVLERTREIGLLRAVGLRRRQLGAMITIEAVATAVFGAVLGTLLGLGLGIALQQGLRSQGLTTLGIPWLLVLGMLAASVLVGILAAVAPSVRAARLDILEAVAG